MKGINSQKGQALILIAFGIVALIGFTALAVDGGRVFSDRRNAQNAADTSALAAALEYIYKEENETLAKVKAVERAASNNYQTDADHTVIVEFCDEVPGGDPPCDLPGDAVPSEYIRVRIISNVPMTFARVLGREFVTNRVEAISRVDSHPPILGTIYGAGMFATKKSGNDCYTVTGTADLRFHDSGVFVNCDGSDAFNISGAAAYVYMDANAQIVGCSDNANQNPPRIDGTGKIDCGATQQDITKDTYKDIPTTLPAPKYPNDCPTKAYKSGDTWYPGYFDSDPSIKSTEFLSDGTYCFINGSAPKLSGGASMKGGKVKLVLSDDLDLKGGENQFDSLEIYMNDADFTVTATGVLTANRMRFFGVGDSTFTVGAQGELTCHDMYIYSEEGEIDIQAGADVAISAPPAGDTFGGLLMYMPWDNPNDFTMNGSVGNVWTGLILMPTAHVTYNGSAGFELHGQIIAETFDITGTAEGDIYFVASDIFGPAGDPTIEFTK
jgi:hypothetical protein